MSEIEIKKSNKHTLFCPAFIDDYGFTAEEFRIFARIMRRSYGEKGCFESVPSLAESLQIGERFIRQALHVLEKCHAITRTPRPGKTDLVDFNPCDQWLPSEQLKLIRASYEDNRKLKDRERHKRSKENLPLANLQPLPLANLQPLPLANLQPLPLADSQDEGTEVFNNTSYPIEGNPIKGENAPAQTPVGAKPAAAVETPKTDVVSRTSAAIGFTPCLAVQETITRFIAESSADDWISTVTILAAPLKSSGNRNYLEKQLGYWLNDFRNKLERGGNKHFGGLTHEQRQIEEARATIRENQRLAAEAEQRKLAKWAAIDAANAAKQGVTVNAHA